MGLFTKNKNLGIKLYPDKPNFKWVVLIVSIIIGAGSIVYTNELVSQIRLREQRQIDLYAETLEYLSNENESSNPNLIFLFEQVIEANSTIPVILTDANGHPQSYRNIPKVDKLEDQDKKDQVLRKELADMRAERDPILVTLMDGENQIYGYNYIYYKNSFLLTQLKYYPYVQLSIIGIFALITFAVFNYSRTAEQNRVWVGLAKETAHQLGTPLSSLMAWVEYMKETLPDQEEIVKELQKDVDRLEMITERFSSIGSVPHLKEENIYLMVVEVAKYLESRISKKIHLTVEAVPTSEIICAVNEPLFAWVIENIVKNAVDAMQGKGDIAIRVMKVNEGQVAIDISDTGKGMTKSQSNQIFNPGFTTKKRGWGLGLALTRRIVENYHGGKVFVKKTEMGRGTTFRILLKS